MHTRSLFVCFCLSDLVAFALVIPFLPLAAASYCDVVEGLFAYHWNVVLCLCDPDGQPQPLGPNRQTVPVAFSDMGLWEEGVGDALADVTKKLSLQHAERLYRVEDDVAKAQFSVDVSDVVNDEVLARREALEKRLKARADVDTHSWQGWTEPHSINVASLPSDSLLTVVSKKYGWSCACQCSLCACSPRLGLAAPPCLHHVVL
jgi:hypothetical protein